MHRSWKPARVCSPSRVRIPISPPHSLNKALIYQGFFISSFSQYAIWYAIDVWLLLFAVRLHRTTHRNFILDLFCKQHNEMLHLSYIHIPTATFSLVPKLPRQTIVMPLQILNTNHFYLCKCSEINSRTNWKCPLCVAFTFIPGLIHVTDVEWQ